MPGDATNPALLARAVAGADAVILAVGVPRNLRALQATTLFSSITQALIPAMEDAGVKRLLTVTGFGAGDSEAKLSTLEKISFQAGSRSAPMPTRRSRKSSIKVDARLDHRHRPGILNDNADDREIQGAGRARDLAAGINQPRRCRPFPRPCCQEDGSHIHKDPRHPALRRPVAACSVARAPARACIIRAQFRAGRSEAPPPHPRTGKGGRRRAPRPARPGSAAPAPGGSAKTSARSVDRPRGHTFGLAGCQQFGLGHRAGRHAQRLGQGLAPRDPIGIRFSSRGVSAKPRNPSSAQSRLYCPSLPVAMMIQPSTQSKTW